MQKSGVDMSKLKVLLETLSQESPLDAAYKAHPLKGVLRPYWEAHIEPDWLLIYLIENGELRLARTGTHSDLFKK
jgi:mRNA interferase YafQ